MAERGHYPEYWEADVVLRDGATAHVRPIAPQDSDALQAFHKAQSQTSIYFRFFSYKPELSGQELHRFTEVDHQDRVAFVVTVGGEIIGVGRYDRLDDPTEAEVAFNIADGHQGRGLGSILLEHLAAAARENGIHRFSAEVLPENGKMLTVFADAGYEIQRRFDDGVVRLEFAIDPTARSRAVMEAREHRAEARSVAGLLNPAAVMVVESGNDDAGRLVASHLVAGGFRGPVHLVNLDAGRSGQQVLTSISAVPAPVTLAVILVSAHQVPDIVDDCAAVGVKGLVMLSDGFTGNAQESAVRQRQLVRQAREHGMRVIGPASLGLINTHPDVSLNATAIPTSPLRGSLGLFTQSAGIGTVVHAAALRRSLGVSSFISAGNRADVSGNDAMQYWEDDGATSAVGLYLESIGNPRKFSRIARRLSRSRPVIVAKSDVMGLRLPPGHVVRTSQAPAGALDAMLRQSGVIRAATNEQLMDIAQIVVSQPLPSGPGVAVLSNSPALGTVLADTAAGHRLDVADIVTAPAPDLAAEAALSELSAAVRAVLARPAVHAVVVALLPIDRLSIERTTAMLAECSAGTGKPLVVAFPGIADPSVRSEGLLCGIPSFSSPGAAVESLAAVVRYAEWAARDQGTYVEPDGTDPDRAAELIDKLMARVPGTGLLTLQPQETAELLDCYGIRVLPSVPFETEGEAVAAAERLGWPVAIKTVDELLRHRLDLGGVRLNIVDAESLRRNIAQMRQVLAPLGNFRLEIQTMAPAGQACTLRAVEDPLLGPVVSFGLAGDAVNLLDDWAHRIPPLMSVDVADLVRSPRAARKLFGYQGLPPVHIASLEDLIARLALLKDEHPETALLQFNPVLVSPAGLTVLNAEVRIGNPQQRTDSARRAMRE